MKSLVKAILLIMILMLGCILCVAAQAEMWGEWQYSYDSSVGTAKITMYAGSDSSVTVPSSINGYTVTAIGENAFTGNLAKSVFLPDTVTEIQRGADFIQDRHADFFVAVDFCPGIGRNTAYAATVRLGDIMLKAVPE